MKIKLLVLSQHTNHIDPDKVLDYLLTCSTVDETDPTIEYAWSSHSAKANIDEPDLGGVWFMSAFDVDINRAVEGVEPGLHVVTVAPVGQLPLIEDLVDVHTTVLRYEHATLDSVMHLPLSYDGIIEMQGFTYQIPELAADNTSLLAYLARPMGQPVAVLH